MGIGGGPTPTIRGATIDGYIKDAQILFDLFTFADGGSVKEPGDNHVYYNEITSDSLGGWHTLGRSNLQPLLENKDLNVSDFFLIRSKGGTDISTNNPVTDEYRMFLDTDMETIVDNDWGANLDIITTIASYAVQSFVTYPAPRSLDWSDGSAARIDTGGEVIASSGAFTTGRHSDLSPFKIIAGTYNMLNLPNTYYKKTDFIVDEDIEKAIKTQQLEALVYILKNLYCDTSSGKAIDGDTVLKAIGKTVVDVATLGGILPTDLFDGSVIIKIMENIAEPDGVVSKNPGIPHESVFFNTFKDFIITVMAVYWNGEDLMASSPFEERYKEIIKITEGIKEVLDEVVDDPSASAHFYSDPSFFLNDMQVKADNITLGTIVRPPQ